MTLRRAKGITAKLRASKRAKAQRDSRAVYHAVDLRDGLKSRLSGIADQGIERHHLRYRSLGGGTTTENVISLTPAEHNLIHQGWLRLEGNADIIGGVQVWSFSAADFSIGWIKRPNI